jgi:AraC family transcriptional regulator
MDRQKLYIKGMVCERCIESVRGILQDLCMDLDEISLGEVTLKPGSFLNVSLLEERLQRIGFSLLHVRNEKVVQDLKALIENVYSGSFDFHNHFNFARLAAEKLNLSYETISGIFINLENITVEKFVLQYRIEKAKELLAKTNKTLSDISFALGFSSTSHLSKQFKQITGLNPSAFRIK